MKCPHLNCLVYHEDGVCTCDMYKYCDKCNGTYKEPTLTHGGSELYDKNLSTTTPLATDK